ncbi:MAG: tRNA 2-thiouridine(34) synthase MnmA [Actinomycetota bacterium]
MKILVAMSGGVDSSVAAAMLAREGHEVTGVHLRLTDLADSLQGARPHGCCGVADADDARRVAQMLDIPFYVWNLKDEFASTVIADFIDEYARGRTPNPCIRCNEKVKFGALLDRAVVLGFDAVATGHYARAVSDGERWRLFRGADAGKDQSYVLARLAQEQLARARFPLGDLTKPQVREMAADLDLRTAAKPDSYEICFVADGDAAGFVGRALGGSRAGDIVDSEGAVVGRHEGIHAYTVGQRRGLGLGSSQKNYVLELDPERDVVVVGPDELLLRRGLEAGEVVWISGAPPERIDVVQTRAHGAAAPAELVRAQGAAATVRFAEPQRGIAPGQLVAFYAGDEVLGGGSIARAFR